MDNLTDTITDGVVISDHDWRLTFVNREGADFFNSTPAALLGKNIWSVCPDEAVVTFYVESKRVIASQTPATFRVFCDRLDTWFEVHAYPSTQGLVLLLQHTFPDPPTRAVLQTISAPSGDQKAHQAIEKARSSASLVREVIGRIQAETSLRRTNAQLAEILESISDGVCVLDQEWRFSYLNPVAEEYLQKYQTELLSKNIWDAFPNLVGSRFYHQCHQVAQTRRLSLLEEFSPYRNCWLQYKIYPASTGVSIYFHDISDRKQAELERQKLLDSCDFLTETSRVLAASLDLDTTLATLLRSVVPFLADYCLIHSLATDRECSSAVLHRDPLKQALVEELAEHFQAALQTPGSYLNQVLRAKAPMMIPNYRYEMKAGSYCSERVEELYQHLTPKSCILIPLIARGQTFGILAMAIAESDRRYCSADLLLTIDLACRAALAINNSQLYQEAQEANRLKHEFLANLSHELRTPLHAIWGWAQMLTRRAPDDQTMRQGLDTIERKANDLKKIVYDLLDLSRIAKGKLGLQVTRVDLAKVIQDAIASLEFAAKTKSIQIETHLDSNLVQGDDDRLRHVFWHLLSNAIKFTPSDGKITVCLTRKQPFVDIEIRDTGTGIAPQFLPYIFYPFRQADGSSTRSHQGLGLGLSLTRYLVEMHGGTISITSVGEGQGTIVTVRLPPSETV